MAYGVSLNEGTTDIDMNGFPPEGVYAIISVDTLNVMNQTVDTRTAEGKKEKDVEEE